tara:strand:- start:288 stop:419 length:132 start_codon:yes stop_codon:yes gene_type:complete
VLALDIIMQEKVVNFFYWLLMKIAESYYGESMKTKEFPYSPYF